MQEVQTRTQFPDLLKSVSFGAICSALILFALAAFMARRTLKQRRAKLEHSTQRELDFPQDDELKAEGGT